MNKVDVNILHKQMEEVDKTITRLRESYRFNQIQIKAIESEIQNHSPVPSANLQYVETLKILRNREQDIGAEGRFLKDEKERVRVEIEKLKNLYYISPETSKKELQQINIIKYSLSTELLRIVDFLYSNETYENVFLRVVGDWREEYFEALFKKEIWKARWINVRYTYAFIIAMWQKSPIGDLIEFVSKLAK